MHYWNRQRKPRPQVTVSVPDPAGEGEIELTLQKLRFGDEQAALREAEPLIAEFITGTEAEPPHPYPMLVEGQPVKLSQALIEQICLIVQMQPEPIFDFDGFLSMHEMEDEAFERVIAAAQQANRRKDDGRGNLTATSSPSSPAATSGTPS